MRVTTCLLVLAFLCSPVLADDPPAGATPCSAPTFQKVGEFQLPTCGAPVADAAKISGTILVTDRTASQIRQVILTRKGKMLAHASYSPAPDNLNATLITFEYSEPGDTYQPPLDVVIVPVCGPVLSISVDRAGRCG
jgi:hypothetical protein